MAKDVALQILKHLKREAQPTVAVIDQYCQAYDELFPEVRSYECFKHLHQGIVSPIARKSLPEIAKVVGIYSAQSLHHFIAHSPWSTAALEQKRLQITLEALKGQSIALIIDETGDRKKGTTTDYVARQYLGSVGKVDRGIVSVNAYGVYENITFPLKFKVFKPKGTLQEGDQYQTKIEIATAIVNEILELGFKVEVVLADSLYGEASSFIETLEQHKLAWVLSIRNNHGVWIPVGNVVRANKWCQFERIFSNEKTETRYIREIIFGHKSYRSYWEITTDPDTMPPNTTTFVMTNIQAPRVQLKKTLGNLYGLRTWVEYSFRQCKQELGWTDYRFTDYQEINRWWEIILSSYLMVSLSTQALLRLKASEESDVEEPKVGNYWTTHRQWNHQIGWKNVLNNLRLILQPSLVLWLLSPWLEIFPSRALLHGLQGLVTTMNHFQFSLMSG